MIEILILRDKNSKKKRGLPSKRVMYLITQRTWGLFNSYQANITWNSLGIFFFVVGCSNTNINTKNEMVEEPIYRYFWSCTHFCAPPYSHALLYQPTCFQSLRWHLCICFLLILLFVIHDGGSLDILKIWSVFGLY